MDELTKNEELGDLYAYYGSLLTKGQQSYFEDYYYNDLSLGEIAVNHNVSRQAIYDNLKRSTKILKNYEAKLHMRRDNNHIEDYKMVSISDQILYDRLKNASFPLTDSLDRLSSAASSLVSDYLHFVSLTASNSLKVNRADLEFAEFSYYPEKADRYFLCTWENNMEVCPAFLKSIGMY